MHGNAIAKCPRDPHLEQHLPQHAQPQHTGGGGWAGPGGMADKTIAKCPHNPHLEQNATDHATPSRGPRACAAWWFGDARGAGTGAGAGAGAGAGGARVVARRGGGGGGEHAEEHSLSKGIHNAHLEQDTLNSAAEHGWLCMVGSTIKIVVVVVGACC